VLGRNLASIAAFVSLLVCDAGPALASDPKPAPRRVADTPAVPKAQAPRPAADREADIAFVQMMVTHYQLAFEMTRIAIERASRDELRVIAQRMIEAQEQQLAELRLIARALASPSARGLGSEPADDEWPTAVQAIWDPDTEAMLNRLRAASGREFDSWFLTTVIAQGDTAVGLSRDQARLSSPQIRDFARRVRQQLTRELRELRLLLRSS
jgi:uncharacterized protein (DUF305 family)